MLYGSCKRAGQCACGLCDAIELPRRTNLDGCRRGGEKKPPPRQVCHKGHKFTPENTVVRSQIRNGKSYTCRMCKLCIELLQADIVAKRRQKSREQAAKGITIVGSARAAHRSSPFGF